MYQRKRPFFRRVNHGKKQGGQRTTATVVSFSNTVRNTIKTVLFNTIPKFQEDWWLSCISIACYFAVSKSEFFWICLNRCILKIILVIDYQKFFFYHKGLWMLQQKKKLSFFFQSFCLCKIPVMFFWDEKKGSDKLMQWMNAIDAIILYSLYFTLKNNMFLCGML